MSMPDTDTLERETDKLWVTDAELIRRMGVPRQKAREAIAMLDAQRTGFPKKEKLWGDRRYWPAVKAYFDGQYTSKVEASQRRNRA